MKKSGATALGILVGLSIALMLTLFAGENPFHILQLLLHSAFGSTYDLGMTLSYATPMIFCGLSVALAFHSGLFNVGAEGQLTVAALATSWLGLQLTFLPPFLASLCALLGGLLAAGFWGAFAAWMKVHRSSHEVVVTIMLNFIAAGLASYVTLELIPNAESQNPETQPLAAALRWNSWDPVAAYFVDTPANVSLLVAILAAFLLWIFLWYTPQGYELRATGLNPEAAERAGISTSAWKVRALFFAGLLAGLVALSEIIAGVGKYRLGFSPDYGFMGIAVALAAANNPLGILFSGFLLGALHKGASDLDLETESITRDFSKILQASIILGIASGAAWKKLSLKGLKKWKSFSS